MFGPQLVYAVFEETAGGGVKRDDYSSPGRNRPLSIALRISSTASELLLQHRREAALVPDANGIAAVLQHPLSD